MGLLKPRPKGYRMPYKVPPANPSSAQVVRAAVKRRLADGPFGRVARMAVERNLYIVGSNASACRFDPSATMANAIVNASSGVVTVRENVFLGHGVQLLAGTHDVRQTGRARQEAIPGHGCDIEVGQGAWIASNVTVIGPCVIGQNAVVCAGAVVTGDVPPNTMVGGVPAKFIQAIDFEGKPSLRDAD